MVVFTVIVRYSSPILAHREDPVSRILSGGGVWHKINLSKWKLLAYKEYYFHKMA